MENIMDTRLPINDKTNAKQRVPSKTKKCIKMRMKKKN